MRCLLPLLAVLLALSFACAQENPVTNGSFEAVNPDGTPVDWQIMGKGQLVATARTGQKALQFDRAADEKTETGLNRDWKINSGERGAMLAVLKGGLEFWYQAPALGEGAKLVVGLIAMNDVPVEGTGANRVMYEVPRAHVGDKQWHRGLIKYDFTDNDKVKWVHVAARIYSGSGQLLLDDIKWVPSVGPLPKVDKITLTETPGREGEECLVKARLMNVGDQPMQAATATLVLPDRLSAAATDGGPADSRPLLVPATAPDGIVHVAWTVTGTRDKPAALTVRLASGEQTAENRLDLAPKIVVEQLRADRFVLTPGEKTTLRLFVRNEGNAIAKGLKLGDQTLAPVRPGLAVTKEWTVALDKARTERTVVAEVTDGAQPVGKAQVTLVCGPPLPTVPAQRPGPFAVTWSGGAAVGNDTVRLVLAVDSDRKAGPGWLQVNKAGQWQTVGVLPYLGYIATAPASQGGGMKPLQARVEKAAGGILGLVSDERCYFAFEPTKESEIQFRLMYNPRQDESIYGVHGPLLYVGEGTWGAKKTEAILPGLEWLTPEEESSSTLDIAPAMPQRWRWCPPPHAVTIPCMSVNTDGITVGLLWDQLQKIRGEETRPRAIFGAPDRFEGRNACLLGLMAPGGADPDWWIPPRLATEEPWTLKKDEMVTLQCRLYAKAGDADALTAMDRWAAIYGLPKPAQLPHGAGMNDEIGFSARGYLESLWDPKTQKWFASLNGPQQMTTLGWHPAYMYDLHYARLMAQDEATRAACTERLALVERLSGHKPMADDLGFEFGNPVAALIGQADRVAGLLHAQHEDGSWRFHARIEKSGIFAGMDYGELGKDQASESGLTAFSAYTVLRYARMTGDPVATAAGLKALKALDQFTVPRAAQVWEVPVHTPDVLASADACEAYLEGYQITGDKAYLQKAVFWARTGIMFNYMWDTPGYETLRYASIPVLGASWYTCNWFGQPVQWNGLRLARAYVQLDQLDKSYPWRQIAEGLTISCMWQQHGKQVGGKDIWPDHNEKWLALWPDNFHCVDLKRCPWVFAPRQILDMVYRLYGMQPDPATVAVTQNGQALRISACGAVSNAKWAGEKLTATLICRPPQTSQVVICNIAQPQSVKVEGNDLPETPRLATAAGPGWEYSPTCKALHIKLTDPAVLPRAQPNWPNADLEISGAKFAPGQMAVAIVTKMDFGFAADSEGWRPACDLSDAVVRDGVLSMTTTGTDPYFVRSSLDLAPDSVKTVLIRMALPATAQGELQVFWSTADAPGFDEAKSVKLPLVRDGQMHDYQIPLGDNRLWAGQRITGFRIDPGSGPAETEVRIDAVRGM